MEGESSKGEEGSVAEPENRSDGTFLAKESDGTETVGDMLHDMSKLHIQVVTSEETTKENNEGGEEDPCLDTTQQVTPVDNEITDKQPEEIASPLENSVQIHTKTKAECEGAEGETPRAENENLEVLSRPGEGAGIPSSSENGESCGMNTPVKEQEDLSNCPYYVKWITWKGIKTPIVTQNDNGPCPLLAIINILLLRRAIEFPSMQEMVTTSQLMEYLGDHVLKETPQNLTEGIQRNFEQNMQDALSILPKLKTGLDVNVKFTGVADFEFTPECVVFDLLNIKLYHGWLVDPQRAEYRTAIDGLSYNQLVEKIVASKEPNAENHLALEGLAAENFLEETANQLTHHGLCELNTKLNDDELCVFFRNNHFCTLYKYQNELFVLLTDQGFLTEDRIIWQTLSNVDGDGTFVDSAFKTLPMKDRPRPVPPVSNTLSQEDQDYMLALSLQSEQQQQATSPPQQVTPSQQDVQHQHQAPDQSTQPLQAEDTSDHTPINQEMSQQELLDLQYAIQLQDEEESQMRDQPPPQVRRPVRNASRRQSPQSPQRPSHVQPRDNQRSCIIL